MVEMKLVLVSHTGLARFATVLVTYTPRFLSTITVKYNEQNVNIEKKRECLIAIMNLGIELYDEFALLAENSDEDHALFMLNHHLAEFVKPI